MRIRVLVSAAFCVLLVAEVFRVSAQSVPPSKDSRSSAIEPLPERFDKSKPPEEKRQVVDLQDPFQVMRVGGLLMWPILLCSIVTFTFAIERLVTLRRGRVIPRRFLNSFIRDLEKGEMTREDAMQRCRRDGSPVALVILSAVRRWGRPMSEIEQAINEGGEREVLSLRRNLRALHGSANLATLLGLLGTVIGMILAFNQVALASGQPRAEMLSTGIAQALLTTAFGLAVAIPSLFLHAYFSGRVERLVYEIDQQGLAVAEKICAEADVKENASSPARPTTPRTKGDRDAPVTRSGKSPPKSD